MPNAGPHRTSLIFLADRQAERFSNPKPTQRSITDRTGVVWQVVSGRIDANEENYGVFDGASLIAIVTLSNLPPTDDDCFTGFWSIGKIEVVNQFQRRGIGPGLLDAVFALHGQPLGSDLDQDGGGVDLWRRWIKHHPGKIELYTPDGSLGPVRERNGTYSPDPWEHRETRLVRTP